MIELAYKLDDLMYQIKRLYRRVILRKKPPQYSNLNALITNECIALLASQMNFVAECNATYMARPVGDEPRTIKVRRTIRHVAPVEPQA